METENNFVSTLPKKSDASGRRNHRTSFRTTPEANKFSLSTLENLRTRVARPHDLSVTVGNLPKIRQKAFGRSTLKNNTKVF